MQFPEKDKQIKKAYPLSKGRLNLDYETFSILQTQETTRLPYLLKRSKTDQFPEKEK